MKLQLSSFNSNLLNKLLTNICELQTVQLYEMIIVRHGLMVVGLPFSGKSCMLRVLAGALSDLKEQGKLGPLFDKVEMRVLNPKSVTMGQLYGENDKATQEWKVSRSSNSASYFFKVFKTLNRYCLEAARAWKSYYFCFCLIENSVGTHTPKYYCYRVLQSA